MKIRIEYLEDFLGDGNFGGIILNYLSVDNMYWEFDGKIIKKINLGFFDYIYVYYWK